MEHTGKHLQGFPGNAPENPVLGLSPAAWTGRGVSCADGHLADNAGDPPRDEGEIDLGTQCLAQGHVVSCACGVFYNSPGPTVDPSKSGPRTWHL